MVTQTHTLIVGASVSGLASAAALQKQNIEYLVIEKEAQAAAPWRNHYNRLHLHTSKQLSSLPFKKFDRTISRYPSRQQVVDYLEAYQKTFNIQPLFHTKAQAIKQEGDNWITETNRGTFQSKYLIMATGPYSEPRAACFKGIETFPGPVLHSAGYKSGEDFKGKKVLVVGFGNSACEIAIDLYERGALPSMAVRSPVNIIPRDLFGIPILHISLFMSRLPPRLADRINAPLLRLLFGDLSRLGLSKMRYGTFEQIQKKGTIPLIDIGTVKHIRKGHIKIYSGIDSVQEKTVHFTDGRQEDFDAIVAAIGYDQNCARFLQVEKDRLEDLKVCVDKQQFFGKDGLYFCGFWIGPTGQIREIASDAQKIAKDIVLHENRLKLPD